MRWYCEKCRTFHEDNELCPRMKVQLKEHPEWIGEAGKVATLAGEYELVSSQMLDGVAKTINKMAGTKLSYEGTHQFARDIQVFKRLDTEAFCNSGVFHTPGSAQAYLNNATPGQIQNIVAKVNGSGQEVEWVRYQQGKLNSIFQKSELLNKNAVGVDGTVINRFNGKEITRVTVKAAQSKGGINTNVQDVVKALKLGRLAPDEVVFGVEGTKSQLENKLQKEIEFALKNNDTSTADILQQAKDHIKVVEKYKPEEVAKARDRMLSKIANGEAVTNVSPKQVASKALDGGIIAAAVGFTVSGITNYVLYKNGEKTKDEVFRDIAEDTLKGALVGAAVSAVSIFLPEAAIGFALGFGVGMYIDTTCKNVLDEIFGKGAYAEILNACGYVAGTAANIAEMLKEFEKDITTIESNCFESRTYREHATATLKETQKQIENNQNNSAKFNKMLEEL